MKKWRQIFHHRAKARRWNDRKYYITGRGQILKIVRRFNVLMDSMTLVGARFQDVCNHPFVARIKNNLSVQCDDVGDGRPEISRTDNTDRLIR